MHEAIRSCQGGGRLSFVHDATMCQCCVHTNLFYTIFRPALERLNKLNNCSTSSDDYERCGILTFLEGCLRFGFITNEAKSDISSIKNPPDYTPLLDSIVNAKKKYSNRPSYSASIRALLYKYKKKANETKIIVPKERFEDCLEESTSALSCKDDKKAVEINITRRRVSKRHFDKCCKDPTPALPDKCKRKAPKTNETKMTRKQHLEKCPKDSTPALLNKNKRKVLKTNKTNQTNCRKGPATAGKKKSKAPKPKPKKKVFNKIPAKGTLKRKRWFVKQIETEENYEDDMFENSPTYRLAMFDEVSQCPSDYTKRGTTPTWDFTPSPRPDSPLPDFYDIENVAELKKFRKEAEEYQFRRKKEREFKIESQETTSPAKPRISWLRTPSTTTDEVKEEDRNAHLGQPSCSTTPLKNEEYDSDEITPGDVVNT